MCGICGNVSFGAPPAAATVDAMTRLLAHRGPDGAGSYVDEHAALGHRRLAIIDLSDAGLQPFASDDGHLQLLHNGEIYNYRELRHELEARGYRFRSATDTEVILAAYSEWGDDCVRRFNGMWALALWDARRRRLLCSRDRFGVKPFYYRHTAGALTFASEIKAFEGDPSWRAEPNLEIVRDYVGNDWFDHTDETFFVGVRKLPAAHSLVFDESGLKLHRYWQLAPREAAVGDAAEEVRELFLDAVRLRLRSDVRVGTCLSGGIDSSAVACAVDHLLHTEAETVKPVGERQATFTVYFDVPGKDERPFARAVVERTIATPTWVTFDAADLVRNLPSIVEAHDEPFRSTSICAGWYVMRAAREAGVTVVLDGQGGDEVFAGYPAYWPARFADLLHAGRLGELAAAASGLASTQGGTTAARALARAVLPEALQQRAREWRSGSPALLGGALASLPDTPAETPVQPGVGDSRLQSLMARILTGRGLPELLHAEDRNSMAHSLEARVPFLDYRLAELTLALDGGRLLERGTTKAVLRHALADLLPPQVAARRDKLGFVTPEVHWLRGPLGAHAEEVFSSASFRGRGFVDAAAARARLTAHREGRLDAGFELWRALNVELWARRFLDRRPG